MVCEFFFASKYPIFQKSLDKERKQIAKQGNSKALCFTSKRNYGFFPKKLILPPLTLIQFQYFCVNKKKTTKIYHYHYTQYFQSANFNSKLSIKTQDLSLLSLLSMYFSLEGLYQVNTSSCYHCQSIHDRFLFKLGKFVLNVLNKFYP